MYVYNPTTTRHNAVCCIPVWRLLSEFIDRSGCAVCSRTGRVRLEGDTVSSTRGRSVLKVKFKEVI